MPKYKVKANISVGYKDFSAGEEYDLTKEEVKAIGDEYLEPIEEKKTKKEKEKEEEEKKEK
ncbi:MAG: hypothetical protein WCI36_03010 [bacterium]